MLHHQKKSELQIGKESRGISSDYRRPPPLLNFSSNSNASANDPAGAWQDEALVLSTTPHKRLNLHQGALIHPQHRQADAAIMAGGLARGPSLLSRCPTIKGRIDSFASLGDATATATATAILHHRGLGGRRFKSFQVLLPPFVVVSVPCFWWYLKVLQAEKRLADLNSDSDTIVVVGLWFDFFAALVFVTAVVISLKIAFPRIALALPWSLRQSWGSFTVAWSKPLAALLSDDKEKKKNKSFSKAFSRSTVTWTIGSKPKVERSPSKVSTEGVQVYSNGDVYEGEFHQGKCSGSGVYYYCMSGRYEGDWVDGKYDGYGVETWAKGSRYRGQYRQGLRHGYGVYRFYTGDVYTGEWSNGQSHGYGVHTCEDGSRYVGEFKWGVKHGLGYYHFRNGDTYAGEYFSDKMHGFGVYHFANGHRYEGAWHEGRKQGLGMYIFRNGERQSGHWHHGVLETPSTQNSQPRSPIAVNHSKVLNAVQEARRAAEKAFETPRVDERVNKAISAANRAANAARIAAVKAVQKRMHGNVPIADV